jgi:GT2 family glycosyltransferase
LKRAIRSVLNQNYGDIAVHVFDDASGDETEAVVKELSGEDPRVKYFCQPQNAGMMPNTAAAVASVGSEFFTILNDDDFLAPGFFEQAASALERYPDAGAYVGRLVYWQEDRPERTQVFASLKEGYYTAPRAFLEVIATGRSHTWASMMFRRGVLEVIGGVDASVRYAADLDFYLRVLSRFPAVFSDLLCAIYCIHPGSSSYDDSLSPYIYSCLRILDKLERDPNSNPEIRQRTYELARRNFAYQIFKNGLRATVRGHFDAVRDAYTTLDQRLSARNQARILRWSTESSCIGAGLRIGLRSLRTGFILRERSRRNRYRDFVHGVLVGLDESCSGGAAPTIGPDHHRVKGSGYVGSMLPGGSRTPINPGAPSRR